MLREVKRAADWHLVCDTSDTCCNNVCVCGCLNERPDGSTDTHGTAGGCAKGALVMVGKAEHSGRRGARRWLRERNWPARGSAILVFLVFLSPVSCFLLLLYCFGSLFFSLFSRAPFSPALSPVSVCLCLSLSLSRSFLVVSLLFIFGGGSLSKAGVPVACSRNVVPHGAGEWTARKHASQHGGLGRPYEQARVPGTAGSGPPTGLPPGSENGPRFGPTFWHQNRRTKE